VEGVKSVEETFSVVVAVITTTAVARMGRMGVSHAARGSALRGSPVRTISRRSPRSPSDDTGVIRSNVPRHV
jgi:hypothetical protein